MRGHVADLGPSRRPKSGGGRWGGHWALIAAPSVIAWRLPRARTFLPIPWAIVLLGVAVFLASGAPDNRRVVLGASSLAFLEVMIVSGIVSVFSAFSSPFLSAMYTVGVFIVGREADTLARLPLRVFGSGLKHMGAVLRPSSPTCRSTCLRVRCSPVRRPTARWPCTLGGRRCRHSVGAPVSWWSPVTSSDDATFCDAGLLVMLRWCRRAGLVLAGVILLLSMVVARLAQLGSRELLASQQHRPRAM